MLLVMLKSANMKLLKSLLEIFFGQNAAVKCHTPGDIDEIRETRVSKTFTNKINATSEIQCKCK